jgi:hypothetical protein
LPRYIAPLESALGLNQRHGLSPFLGAVFVPSHEGATVFLGRVAGQWQGPREKTFMRSVSLKIPEVGFIAGTRAAFGAGLGLILADKLNRRQRKRAGWVLLAIGAVTTVPLVVNVIRKTRESIKVAA